MRREIEAFATGCLGEMTPTLASVADGADLLITGPPQFDHVKVVGQVNYAAIFPACRTVVHHGGAGTLAAALPAGVPQVILWTLPDQPSFAAQLKRLKVGSGRRFRRRPRNRWSRTCAASAPRTTSHAPARSSPG